MSKIAWNKGMRSGITKKCIVCIKEFYVPPSQKHLKYCSQKCYHSIPSNHSKNKGMNWKLSKETKIKQGLSQTGKKNHNWKGGITKDRYSLLNTKWVKKVKKRDCYKCQKCNLTGDIVHHIYSYNKYKYLRFELSNGIVLCNNCHDYFHKKYGFGDNNLKQFLEW